MKRTIALVITVVMIMASLTGAMAERADATLDITTLRKYERVNNLCWVGHTLYILGDEGLYAWQQNSGATMILDMKASAPLRYIDQPPANAEQKSVWEQTIHFIFPDESTLYALHQYSGKIYQLDGEELKLWHALPLDQLTATVDGTPMFRGIRDIQWVNSTLYVLLGSDVPEQWDKTELLAFNPQTEQMTKVDIEHIEQIGEGPAGKLLITRRTVSEADNGLLLEVFYYDPATGDLDKQIALPVQEQLSGRIQYSAKDGSLVFCQGEDITQMKADLPSQVKATLPIAMSGLSAESCISDNGIYAGASGSYVFLRDIAAGESNQQVVLHVMGDINPDIIIQFTIENPDVTVLRANNQAGDSFQQAVLTAGQDVDLFVANAPGPYVFMQKKGYMAPMNDNAALVEKAAKMYPAIQEVLFSGDQLLAFPINIQAYSWTLNQTLWDQFELGEAPSTYTGIWERMSHWDDALAEEYPEYKLLDMDQDVTNYVTALVREYVLQNEQAGAALSFDTPAFREALLALIDHQYLFGSAAESSGMPILFPYSMGFGVGSNDGEKTRMLLPPALSDEDVQTLSASMELLVLNPASEHKTEALAFVQFAAEHMDISMQYMLTPSLMTAMRSSSYEANAARLDGEIADLEALAQTADDSKKADIADQIEIKKVQRENIENFAWHVSPESIECYRTLAENLRIPYTSLYLSNESNSGMKTLLPIVQRFCEQGLTAGTIDAFINDLDRLAQMIYKESM